MKVAQGVRMVCSVGVRPRDLSVLGVESWYVLAGTLHPFALEEGVTEGY
jgi:hypothetical protein